MRKLFSRSDDRTVAEILRTETTGGFLLLIGALVGLGWANSPWSDGYHALLEQTVGPARLHLDLDLSAWAADGLLAIFFFVAGLELKRELVVGDLRDPGRAVVPVVAAVAGVALPAVLYLGVTWQDASARSGWAVPVATDIAFALAVLAVLGSHLPSALRSFLLTLAVVDDLIAITIIAIAYSDHLSWTPLLVAAVPLAAFAGLVRAGRGHWWLLWPLALTTWALVHASGVHATVAGVLLALTVPAAGRHAAAEHLEHVLRPVSAGVAVPLFAFAAAGVTVDGGVLRAALDDPVTLGVVVALVAGKGVGVLGGTWLTARFTRAELDPELGWSDVAGAALLAGIGFTVSLLIGELAFDDAERAERVRLAVLAASLLAGALASVVLVRRNRRHREQLASAHTTGTQ
ncbi:Na+/H+ antiporter NhaA [Spongisporangium articulatum]|uniref:Na(+)/H(+) antiporter NhaA n=1 Tax=Spongisporangium articulatum TaxID=3362603 RepID=A0ABW8AIU0_9ACTN